MTDLRAASNSSHASGNDARALLSLDDDLFTAYFDRHPFKITHDLVTHPLLQLPRLVELARTLNRPILYFNGGHAINQVDAAAGRLDAKHTFVDRKLSAPELSAVETISQIETCRAWMQLRDVGTDPEYAALLRQIIDEFRASSERVAPGLSAPRADIFVSSPGSTTPFHLDEEHNFLLQIRGSKKLSIADGFNPAVLDRERLRSFFSGSGELAPYSRGSAARRGSSYPTVLSALGAKRRRRLNLSGNPLVQRCDRSQAPPLPGERLAGTRWAKPFDPRRQTHAGRGQSTSANPKTTSPTVAAT
jgi:hypothetical protein